MKRRGTSSGEPKVLVGTGIVSPVGNSAPATCAALRAGVARYQWSDTVDRAGATITLAAAPLSRGAVGVDRLLRMAQPALTECLSGWRRNSLGPVPLLLGISDARVPWVDQVGETLISRLAETVNQPIDVGRSTIVRKGHAAGFYALASAIELLDAGAAEAIVIGGVDSWIDATSLEWLDCARRLKSDSSAKGMVPGESGAFCLITTLSCARRISLPVYAVIETIGLADEPCPLVGDGVCIGLGLTTAIHDALVVADDDSACADWTLCNLNGEHYRSAEWIYAYLRTGHCHRSPLELWHPADCLGDVGAASGPLLFIQAAAAWERGYARGPRALVWSASDGPSRGSALLSSPDWRI